MNTKTKWVIDSAQSVIGFEVKHLAISNVKGVFNIFNAGIYTDDNDFLTAAIDFRISTSSINTGDVYRDEYLKSFVFFDVKNHNQITFRGNSMEKLEIDGNYEMPGDLTIKGITRSLKLAVEFEGLKKNIFGRETANFSIEGKINRKDWGLNWNTALEDSGMISSDVVLLKCKFKLKKATIQDFELPIEIMPQQTAAKFVY